MDPATERMLARARARRQKLDAQLKDLGLETSSKRAPLQESNTQFVKVTTEVEVVLNTSDSIQKVNVSPTKVELHNSGEKENLVTPSGEKVSLLDLSRRQNEVVSPKDKSSHVSTSESSPKERNIRSQLKRLGALYSDEQISSPIHRTENKFAVEAEVPVKTTKPVARVARLAALADNIKLWEDDLSHPVFNIKGCSYNVEQGNVSVPKQEESESVGKKDDFVAQKMGQDMQDKTPIKKKEVQASDQTKLSNSCISKNVSPKKMVWDEKVLQLLDNVNEASSSRAKGPQKTTVKTFTRKNEVVECNEKQEFLSSEHIIGITQLVEDSSVPPIKKCTVEKPADVCNSPKFAVSSSPTKGLSSPVKLPPGSPKAGSVLEKASMFESSSPTKKTKDPAELPLSERMAFFERNKGQALIPKAAFSMAVPAKYLESGNTKSSRSPEKVKILKINEDQKADSSICNKVLSCREMFEKGISHEVKDRVASEQVSRQNELEMLRNRWNKNKTLATEAEGTKKCFPDPVHQKVAPPPPPPLPPSDLYPAKTCALPQITHMIPKCPNDKSPTKNMHQQSPRKLSPMVNERSEVCKIRKIKVSPPKPGHLYPCLSDIEATTTEAESEIGDETERDSASSVAYDSDDGNTSFGREILQAAGIKNKNSVNENKYANYMDSSNSDLSESAVLSDIGGCIDEALKGYDSSSESDNEGPTPPKKGREYLHSPQRGIRSKQSPNSKPSQSFKYTAGSSVDSSPSKSPEKYHRSEMPLENNQETPLMHSVSFYRKQQNLAVKNTPMRQIVRPPETVVKMESEPVPQINEEEAIRMKITELLEEVSKQQIVISQASQALNLCMATVEFSESAEQVEGERLLLLATHKRQAALHEVQRLKVEGTLKPISEADPNASFNRGSLMITNICLSMKKDCIRRLPSEETCYHFMCLVRSQDQVLGTQVLAGIPQNLKEGCNLVWNTPLRLVNLYSDFKVTLEVYSLQTKREILPHNVKYHIGGKKDTSKSWLTPKKQKQESLLVMPTVNSPAGPSAVRSPEFRMAGYVVFSLKEISRNHFTLNKVSYSSPLEGSIQLKMKSELSIDVCERGFLTMFEDVSGFGAWHRRWFVLKGSILAYWKYPDDERKIPIGQMDLDTCSTTYVNLVSRDICARPNTFLLETVRPAQPDDKDSLVMITAGDTTTIRVLLSADTKEERLLWCAQINKALSLIRAWGSK